MRRRDTDAAASADRGADGKLLVKSLTVEAEGVLLVLAVDGSRDNRPENFARHAKLRRMRKVVLGDVADRGPEREYATLFFEFSLS